MERREHTGRLEYLSTGRSRGKGRKREKKITIQSGSDEAKRDGEKEWKRRHFREIELEFNKG